MCLQLAEHGAKDDPLAVIGSAAAVVLATPGEQAYTGAVTACHGVNPCTSASCLWR